MGILKFPAPLPRSTLQKLLKIDRYFAAPEPDVADVCYVAVLILVYNAARTNITVPSLCPLFTRSHFTYLRDKWPQYFKGIEVCVWMCAVAKVALI